MKIQDSEIEELNKRFFRKIADRYDRGFVRNMVNRRIKKVLRLANVEKGSRVLDVGCGTGVLLYLLSKDKTLSLYGVDLSREMLEIAEKKLKSRVILKEGPVKHLLNYYRKNYFNYIFVDDAFHHLPDQEETVRNLKLLLKENGKLIISDLSFGRIGNIIFHKIEPGNSKMYTIKQYLVLFEENGFKKIKKENLGLFSIYVEGIKMKEEILQ